MTATTTDTGLERHGMRSVCIFSTEEISHG